MKENLKQGSATTGQNSATSPHSQRIDLLPPLFLVTAFFFLPAGSDSAALNAMAIVFVSIVLETIPFMLVGALIGGLIEAFMSRDRLAGMLPRKGWRTVCVAAAAGILFPVCECAVVPVVRRLMGKGLPFSAAIAYLLAGPIVNPVVTASTAIAYAFDWRVAALRMGLGYIIAVIIAMIMGQLFDPRPYAGNTAPPLSASTPGVIRHLRMDVDGTTLAVDSSTRSNRCGHFHDGLSRRDPNPSTPPIILSMTATTLVQEHRCGCGGPPARATDDWLGKTGWAFRHAMDDFLAVGHYLVIGAFVASLAQTYVERSALLTVTETPLLAVGLMMAMAVLLNLCSESDAFIAASLQGVMPLSGQMAFMLTGPMFDLKLLLMYQGIFHRRAIFILAVLILLFVFGVSAGLEWVQSIPQ